MLKWTPGKVHYIAYALSRYPVFGPSEDAEAEGEHTRYMQLKREDSSLKFIFECAKGKEYQALILGLKRDQIPKLLPDGHAAKGYTDVWDRLSLLDGSKQPCYFGRGKDCCPQGSPGRHH